MTLEQESVEFLTSLSKRERISVVKSVKCDKISSRRSKSDTQIAHLTSTLSTIENILVHIQEVNNQTETLLEDYIFVTNKTTGLQSACDQLLDEEKHLVSLSRDLKQRLVYFNDLDGISKSLNSADPELVLKPSFISTINRIDECILFLEAHVRDKLTQD